MELEEPRRYPCVDAIDCLSCIDGIISDGVRAKRWYPGIHWHSQMTINEVDGEWCKPYPRHVECLKRRREGQWEDFQTPFHRSL